MLACVSVRPLATNPFAIDPRDYKYGMKGAHIVSLQESLVFAGYELIIDGDFGAETKQAIEQFEADYARDGTMSFAVDIRSLTMLFNQVHVEPGPTPPPPPVSRSPEGKGMFIRSLVGTGSVENMKAYIIERGIRWIAVQRIWQYPDESKLYNADQWAAYKEAWEETGCDLWIWGWAIPGKTDEYLEVISTTAAEWGAVGIIIDAEAPWYGEEEEATILIDKMAATGLPIGITSYGAPWFHTSFPFAEFSKAAFGVPQIYDSDNSMPDDYPTRSVDTWLGLGYVHVVPASSAYGKTGAQMTDLLSRTPTPDDAITWWDWYNANAAPGRWDAIGEYVVA